jgi:hypothetical protein
MEDIRTSYYIVSLNESMYFIIKCLFRVEVLLMVETSYMKTLSANFVIIRYNGTPIDTPAS